jgi:asparagine synthetase B (glutamine-hydrolysing)
MCGIWGLLSLNKITYNLNNLFDKFNKIKNRGPDKSTFIVNDNFIIGFHR